MMIRPKNFGYNHETAENNAFQVEAGSDKIDNIKTKAIEEFNAFADKLISAGVNVHIIEDVDTPALTDAVFPNNWISFHQNGAIITYPMFADIRRQERREDVVEQMSIKYGFDKRYSFEYYEEEGMFLEGTGSMIFDRINKVVYACISPRTEPRLLDKWAVLTEYDSVIFDAVDEKGVSIYHTNVMMALGIDFAVVVLDAIHNENERSELLGKLESSGRQIVELTYDQMQCFAGNMLQLQVPGGTILVMSDAAYNSLNQEQIDQLTSLTQILHSDISTIEKFGGGSVRCMMAEVFYPMN